MSIQKSIFMINKCITHDYYPIMHMFERYSLKAYKAWSPNQLPLDGQGFLKINLKIIITRLKTLPHEEYATSYMIKL